MAGLKASMQETMKEVSGYEFALKRIQDIRAHLDSVTRSLQERQQKAGVVATVTEVDMGKPLTTRPTFEAWLDSFTPSQGDIERDKLTFDEKLRRLVGRGERVDTEAKVFNGTHAQKSGRRKTVKICIIATHLSLVPSLIQLKRCMVVVTEEASSYDAAAGYAINLDETHISFFNCTLMFRRPT